MVHDSVDILRRGVRVNGEAFPYDSSLSDALEPLIRRSQTRTRNARDDIGFLVGCSFLDSFYRFVDDISDSPFDPLGPYRDAIVRADSLARNGLIIEEKGVTAGGALAWYASIERSVQEERFSVRFGFYPSVTVSGSLSRRGSPR